MKIINYTILMLGYIIACIYVVTTCNSCGAPNPYSYDTFYMNSVYQAPYEQFVSELKKRNIPMPYITTKFLIGKTAEPFIAGQCEVFDVEYTDSFYRKTTKEYRFITIRPEYVDNPNLLKYLVFHELGHCEFDFEDDYVNQDTIMYWHIPNFDITEEQVLEKLDYALKQLKR
jgi:hypothetical protein